MLLVQQMKRLGFRDEQDRTRRDGRRAPHAERLTRQTPLTDLRLRCRWRDF